MYDDIDDFEYYDLDIDDIDVSAKELILISRALDSVQNGDHTSLQRNLLLTAMKRALGCYLREDDE